jgi:hypothetical protein
MYPSTYPGEVEKRDLDADDESAVQYLYTASVSDQAETGCSSAAAAPGLSFLLVLPMLARRRDPRPQ